MSATHYIATAPTWGPEEVETLHTAGVWALHASSTVISDPNHEHAGCHTVTSYVVTHTPTGARVAWSPSTKEEAIALADALHAAHPAYGVDAPWGKPPSIAGLMPSIDEICLQAMSPRARSVWGEP